MSYAQLYHTRRELRAQGVPTNPRIARGHLTPALTPIVTALGGRITREEGLSITVRLNNNTAHGALTFGGLVAGLAGVDGTVCTQVSRRQVLINFDGGC